MVLFGVMMVGNQSITPPYAYIPGKDAEMKLLDCFRTKLLLKPAALSSIVYLKWGPTPMLRDDGSGRENDRREARLVSQRYRKAWCLLRPELA